MYLRHILPHADFPEPYGKDLAGSYPEFLNVPLIGETAGIYRPKGNDTGAAVTSPFERLTQFLAAFDDDESKLARMPREADPAGAHFQPDLFALDHWRRDKIGARIALERRG